jgi:alpha-tubulin suppressor-like RCC1 family protein
MKCTTSGSNRWRRSATVFVVAAATIFQATELTAIAVVPSTAPTVVLAFGSNRDGQTGLGLTNGSTLIATPIIATNLAGTSIAKMSAGFGISSHSLLLANDGRVFSCGTNYQGETGLGTVEGKTLIATPIDSSNLAGLAITQVAAGWDFSLLLANDGTVFSFGTGVSGATGMGTTSNPTLVATPIDQTNLMGKKITQIDAFGLHSLLLADDGSVFSFGWNSVGQTGQGTSGVDTLIATPIITTNLAGKKVIQVSAGADHSLLLADDGSVFSFGSNSGGESGLGISSGATLIATPIVTTNLAGKKIKQVSAGGLHSLLLAEDGTVFSFGSNGLGASGQGTTSGNTLIATPINTTNLTGKTIAEVSAGSVHSLLLAEDGTVFSFGRNTDGQTGLGTVFSNTTIATPIVTTNLVNKRVIGIAAGDSYSLLLTVVPEPSGAMLLVFASLSLLVRRCRR